MPLIVTDSMGTVAAANSYTDLAAAILYLSERDIPSAGLTEGNLLLAMTYLEDLGFCGVKVNDDQPLSFPRIITQMSSTISLAKMAGVQALVGYYILNGKLGQGIVNDMSAAAIKRKEVDVLTIEYQSTSTFGEKNDKFYKQLPLVDKGLNNLLCSANDNAYSGSLHRA